MKNNKPWCVTKVDVLPLKARLIQPFRTALGDHNTLDNLLIGLHLNGLSKVFMGEAAVASHISGESLSQTEKNLKTAGAWLVGQDVRDYVRISASLHEKWKDNPSLIAAVETAIFDALTSMLDVPLWKFFGVRPVRLKSDITIVIADLEETRESVSRFYRQGFRQFKVKVGRDYDVDIERVKAVKELAPKGDIYLDANQGFSADQMLKFLKALNRYKIQPVLLEQPVKRYDWDGLKKITRSTDIAVCADESVRSIAEAAAIIKEKAADVINIKLMKFGIVHAFEIARMARAAGVKLMIGGMLESSLAMTTSAHLAAGMGCFDFIDLDTPFFIQGDAKRNPYLTDKGVYDLSSATKGIGLKSPVSLKEKDL